jgi:hypothetical protein
MDALRRIDNAIGSSDRPADAVDVVRQVLAECWDDCVMHLPPKLRDADASNPYLDGTTTRSHPTMQIDRLTQYAADDRARRDQLATVPADDPRGVWIVWRTKGVPSDGFSVIFPHDAEINAMRQVNADGFGHAEFIPFGADAGH